MLFVFIIVVVFVFLLFFLYEKVEVVYLVKNIIGYRCGFLNNIVKVVEIFGRIFMVVEFILIICMFIFYGLIGYKLLRIK